ncbi:MAG: Uncharacterized protein FD161_1045 [Limisphaerales bacterium]|nr:MAG: Uncharacterized protein FD161_1045 [Limisphaerales bacterium]KAG0509828.1 MAG: Uncharacterized protein E1N63_1045 [Limisphaerales bacterium]TXT50950.1 MAG: Uncharacterized protein FD140_2012 [Limisphaerales bacterium]
MCIQLASWWNRGTLMNSRHPYIWFKEPAKIFEELTEFVAAVPALNEFLRCDKDGCYFRDEVTREEMKAINDYAMEHYRPPVFR